MYVSLTRVSTTTCSLSVAIDHQRDNTVCFGYTLVAVSIMQCGELYMHMTTLLRLYNVHNCVAYVYIRSYTKEVCWCKYQHVQLC